MRQIKSQKWEVSVLLTSVITPDHTDRTELMANYELFYLGNKLYDNIYKRNMKSLIGNLYLRILVY